MVTDVEIDYEKIVSDYLQSLNTVLRGFNSATGHRFLETWVYDEDDTRSILGIIEAAKDSELPEIAVYLGAATVNKLDLATLSKLASRQGQVIIQPENDGLNLHVSFDAKHLGTALPRDNSVPQGDGPAARTEPTQKAAEPLNALRPWQEGNHGTLSSLYAEQLSSMGEARLHEGVLTPTEGAVLLSASHAGVSLSAVVNSSRHIILKAAYRDAGSEDQRRLLEALCLVLEGKPILEGSDHATIFLESKLRNHSMPPPVPGIVTPENAHPMFDLAKRLVRHLLTEYRRQTGFDSVRNFHDQPVSAFWNGLTLKDKMERIGSALNRHLAGQGIQMVRLELTQRVVVRFQEECDNASKQTRLMQLEQFLKEELEPTLQLYVEPKVDENKLRRSKEATAL